MYYFKINSQQGDYLRPTFEYQSSTMQYKTLTWQYQTPKGYCQTSIKPYSIKKGSSH